jgi:cysteine-rich repeat protein
MNATCIDKCGDGILLNLQLQCDDGNTISGDGCSSTCQIEAGFICAGGSPTTITVCRRPSYLAIA